MTGNFGFLGEHEKHMAHLSRQAEAYVYTDPESCLFKLRLMIETITKRLYAMHLPNAVSEDLSTMLAVLERRGTLTRARADAMHAIRRDGNAAVHGGRTPIPTAMRRLRDAHGITKWYMKTAGDGRKIRTGPFVPPARPDNLPESAREAIARAERLEDEIEQRRKRTRQALMLYSEQDDWGADADRLRGELEALNKVAMEAGEPLVEAESVMLVMAMELEQLLEHPRLGLNSRDAKREAERQLERAKRAFEERELAHIEQRAKLAEKMELG